MQFRRALGGRRVATGQRDDDRQAATQACLQYMSIPPADPIVRKCESSVAIAVRGIDAREA